MITLEYILTFDSGPQVFGEDTFNQVFSDKDQAVVYFKTLTACEDRHLLKVSMCVNADAPSWFMECNGKLWSDDLGTVEYNPYWTTV